MAVAGMAVPVEGRFHVAGGAFCGGLAGSPVAG
jgi:hypothetical protein